jgi:uncharacterized protein with von Willebrand factor type A (vWA) domain
MGSEPALVTERLSVLAARLRVEGVRVGLDELLAGHRALAAVDASSRRESFLALRLAMCSRVEDLPVFADAFDAVFGTGWNDALDLIPPAARAMLPRIGDPGADPPPGAEPVASKPVPAAWSPVELLRTKDFAALSDVELAQAQRMLARLARRGPRRLSRRARPSRRRGDRHDLRATIRASLRYGGEPVERRWRRPTLRQRPVVLVCDVSGSMEPYARMLLTYLQACVAARRRVEAFAFGTRLTRITRELRGRDPDRALRRATEAVQDFSGGTRIGASLGALNREHGRRVGRGAVVVVLSDGWDRGDPQLLADEMRRLRRCAHRVIWLNPLKAHQDYEPLTRGMSAALPHADHFLAGNSVASLEELAELLESGMETT